jgi:hypothetical protein
MYKNRFTGQADASVFSEPGNNVMITIFGDFCQFSAKKLGVFPQNQCYNQILGKTCCSLSKKRQYFRQIVRRKYFKNHSIGPRVAMQQIEKMARKL